MTEGSEQPQGEGTPQQPPAPPPQLPTGGGPWGSPIGKAVADVITNPVSALRVATFAAAFLGLGNLIADMRAYDGSKDSVVWGAFFIDLFYTVVFVSILHALRAIVEHTLKK